VFEPGAKEWLDKAPMHSVMLRSTAAPYDPLQQQLLSFSNTPAEGVHLLPGSTHVAVGFADLGDVAAAVSRWGPAAEAIAGAAAGQLAAFPLEFDSEVQDLQSMQALLAKQVQARTENQAELQQAAADFIAEGMRSTTLEHLVDGGLFSAVGSNGVAAAEALQLLQQAHWWNCSITTSTGAAGTAVAATLGTPAVAAATGAPDQPLLWVGYDASPYAVAKAAVLVQMMKQGADADAVLQVGRG
jgi:hypothetical protein